MIAKKKFGAKPLGAIKYDTGKEGARVIDTNMSGESPGELAREFEEVKKLRPGLKKYVAHISLSAAPGERLTDDEWREESRRYLDGMGYKNNQYIVTRHSDTEIDHVHILVNRIGPDGAVVSDSHDYRRQEAIMREIEARRGLQRVEPSANAARKAPTKGEIERAARTGEPSTRAKLQVIVGDAAAQGGTFSQFHERLSAAGVEVVPVVQQGGERLSGLSYRLDGTVMKGSDLGRGYTAAGIQKGISYDKNADSAAVRVCLDREAARRTAPGGGSPAGGRRNRGQPGQAARGVEVRPGRAAAGTPGGLAAPGVPALSGGGNVRIKPPRKNSPMKRRPQNPLSALRQRPSKAFAQLLLLPLRLAVTIGRQRQAEAARVKAEEQRRQQVREKLRRSDPLRPPPVHCERDELETWVWNHRESGVGERDLFTSATRAGHYDELMFDVLASDDALRRRATRARAEREGRQSLPAAPASMEPTPAQAPHTLVKPRLRRPSRGPELT